MGNVRVAVIGCGHLGQHHARIIAELDGVDLVALVDTDLSKAEELAVKFNSKAYSDYRDVIDTVDAATIVVPTSEHYNVSKDFLKAGVDLLVEKPICSTLEDASRMIDCAEKYGCILQIGHLERFNPGVVALQKRVDKPMFIDSHRIGPFVHRATDVDVTLDLMIHDIDIITSLVQSEATHVHATGVSIVSSNIDIATARLQFESGCVANVTASRVSFEQVRRLRVFQAQNYHSLDYQKQTMISCRVKNSPDQSLPEIVTEHIDIKRSEPLKEEIIAFVESVNKRLKPKVSGIEGMEALRVALMVTHEIEDGLKKFRAKF